jgi:SAM-dependent methyltransferase
LEETLRPVDEPLISAMRLDAPYRVADIGCGGGGTTLEILRRAPAGSVVHGFDISPALLESARARTRPGDPAIAFELADVGAVPPPQKAYERLVSRFGIMFFADPPAAFANLIRWLAPQGRFAFAAWSTPADNPWMTNLRDAAAEVVEVPPLDLEAPGPFRYGDAEKLLRLLGGAGFSELEVRDWRGALAVGGGMPAAEAAQFALASFSVGELLSNASAEAVDAARASLTARFRRYEQDGIVKVDACVHVFTGTRR